jgi:hypothetical protein
MKFPHSMKLRAIVSYDDYGQAAIVDDKPFKCCILDEVKRRKAAGQTSKNQYDMKILVSARTYEPYSILFENNDTRVIYNGTVYEVIENHQINSFSGKPKYYQMALSKVSE